MKDRVIIFCGQSGVGKDYLMRQYLEAHKDCRRIVTYTTRPMRPKETNHIDYHFVDDDAFDVLKLTGRLIEQREYNTEEGLWKYGTPYFIDEWSHEYCGVVDLTGIEAICKAYSNAEIVVNYVHVPEHIRRERAIKRGGFNLAEWERRLLTDMEDFSEEKPAHLNDVLKQYGNPPIQYVNNY